MLTVETAVYIARKLHLPLAELIHWTKGDIGELTPSQFNELMEELQFQEAQEQYRQDYNIASILAAIYNTIPRKNRKTFKPKDFLGRAEPRRQIKGQKSLEELAKEKGIKIPHNPTRKQV